MKKPNSLPLMIAIALVVVAAIVWIAGGVQGKDLSAGALVRINAHATYDRAVVEQAMNKAGFRNPTLLETNRTAIEVQTGSMSQDKLAAAADSFLAAVKATNPDAELVYAETFNAAGVTTIPGFVWALVGIAVLGFLYGWVRFGWKVGLATVVVSLAAALATGAVCLIVSGLLPVTGALLGIVAGVALLTYLYIIVLYARLKEQPEYIPGKADLAVPALVFIACVLALAVGGASVARLMCAAVLGSAIAAWFSRGLAPALWTACTAKKK